ncbi:hypothetical protein [Amycolatopsis tolypomycina]|uniref:hypothetical protein n=1 Tax=Amycolatopsis tolypomycina TaxID=208445 RepID=UPI000B8671CE|nr:hypothetical protein [Amycolatopsis tolypomycina]
MRGRRLTRTWFLVVTVSEFLGFSIPAVAGALTANSPAELPVLLLAGAAEGAALGAGPAFVLRRYRIAAYLLGPAPTTWAAALPTWPPPLLRPVAAVLGGTLLLSIGFAQCPGTRSTRTATRRRSCRSTGPSGKGGVAAPAILIGVLGGLLMAGATSAVTGFAVARLPALC